MADKHRCGNTENQWGFVSRFLHWFMALMILGSLIGGFYMVHFATNNIQGPLIFIHKSLGVLFLGLLIFRYIWRRMNTIPTIPQTSFHTLSKLSAPILYLSMLSMPISGALMSQAQGYPVSFFDLFTLPTILAKSKELGETLFLVHSYCAYILIGLIVVHTLAAFYHHFVLKDQIFQRMLTAKVSE